MPDIAAYAEVPHGEHTGTDTPYATRTTAEWRGLLARAVREPFLHFIVLGALLFGLGEYLEARANFSRITITRDAVAGIITNYQLQYGITPAGQQLDSLIDQYVREEVFYHEALRLGLDRNDEIIR